MKKLVALCAIAALAACSEDSPPAKPAAEAPPPQAAAPAPAPETKGEIRAEAPKPDPNKELARRVKQALEGDSRIQGAAIDVTAKDGRVSLWGTAANAGERSRAAEIARKVDGVASVDNQIKVVKGS
jgi:hypothetical protein